MPFKFTSKTNILLVFLLLFTMLPATVFAQDGTKTFTTADGLSFDYPDDWEVQSIGGFVIMSNSEANMFADQLEPGNIIAFVMGGETLNTEYGEFSDLETAAALFAASLEGDGEAISPESITVGGHNGLRFEMTDESGHNILIILDLDGQFAALFALTNADDIANQEAAILALAESLRYDGAEPTEIEGFDFGDFDDIDVEGFDVPSSEPTVGEEVIVWQQQVPVSEDIFSNLGAFTTMSVSGDTVYVTDGLNIAQIDNDGNVNSFVASSQFTFINYFAVVADGSLWAGTFGEDMLVHLGADLSVIDGWNNEDFDTPIFGDFLGIQEVAISPDGELYMFAARYDDEFNTDGTILVWRDGAFDREFSVQEDDEFGIASFGFDAQIAFTPDGNIMLVDSSAHMKVIDADGNIVRDDFPSISELGIYGINDVAVAPDGSIVLATAEGITRLSADGEFIDSFGTTQEFDFDGDAAEFAAGQFSATGPLAVGVLSDGNVIAISSNSSYNLIIRLDYSLAD